MRKKASNADNQQETATHKALCARDPQRLYARYLKTDK